MSLTAKLLKTDGTEEKLVPKNGTDFSLKEIGEILDCPTFELLQGGNKMYLLIDEDAEEKALDKNQKASEIWAEWNKPLTSDSIFGAAILCSEEMVK